MSFVVNLAYIEHPFGSVLQKRLHEQVLSCDQNLSLVHTSDINITTYLSLVSTSWSIEHLVFPQFKRTPHHEVLTALAYVVMLVSLEWTRLKAICTYLLQHLFLGIHATGPFAHLFRGVVEQSYIFHVMDYALCLTESKQSFCTKHVSRGGPEPGSSASQIISCSLQFYILGMLLSKYIF